MTLDSAPEGDLNKDYSKIREDNLTDTAVKELGEEAESFLSTKFKDAGWKTPREMAAASKAGYETALCLLRPVSGC